VVGQRVQAGARTTDVTVGGRDEAMGLVTGGRDLVAALALADPTVPGVVVGEVPIPSGSRLVVGVEGASDGTAGLSATVLETRVLA